jgi:RNA polymerase sigma factor (sigma-70 family)
MSAGDCLKTVAWVGREVLPHEGDVRAWLRRTLNPSDLEDVIQESYCRISALDSVAHIRSGRAYLFTTARMVVLERMRRSKIVSIDTAAEVDALSIADDEPSPERVISGRRELARVRHLIADLPDRCRKVIELRKIQGLSQRDVAHTLNVPEHTVENDVAKGLKLILQAIADGEVAAEKAFFNAGRHERTRDTRSDL